MKSKQKKEDPCSSDFIKDEKVLSIIKKRLSVREEEKNLYGEVFTPIELICDMFNKLPKNVWMNPNLKWLDPAGGIGNFSVVAYYKLFETLKTKIPNSTKRSKHIIENMLYMVELNPVNIRVCKKIFKMIDNKAIPNIAKNDFLKFKGFKDVDKFDVIMGNPPYQKKVGSNKSYTIWHIFVIDSIEKFLNKNGYLVFVHPNGWRDIKGFYRKVYDLIIERELMSLTMRDYKTGAQTFGGSWTNFDYYCLRNKLSTKNKTKINDIDHKEFNMDLNDYDFIPSGKFDVFEKLKGKKGKHELVDIIYSSSAYETRGKPISKHPISNKKDNVNYKYHIINTITKKKGPSFIYSNEKDPNIFIPKVIWSNGIGTYPIIDSKGEYGLTQFSYGISDEPKNLKYIKEAMEHKDFIELNKYLMGQKNKYNYKIIGTFKKDFYKHFLSNKKQKKTIKKKKK